MTETNKQIEELLKQLAQKLHMKPEMYLDLGRNIRMREQQKTSNDHFQKYVESLLKKDIITQADISPALITSPIIPVFDNSNQLPICKKCGQIIPVNIIYQCGHKFCIRCQHDYKECPDCGATILYRLMDTTSLVNMKKKNINVTYKCPNICYQCDSLIFDKIFDLEAHYNNCPYTVILKTFSLEQLQKMPNYQQVQLILNEPLNTVETYIQNILRHKNLTTTYPKDKSTHPELEEQDEEENKVSDSLSDQNSKNKSQNSFEVQKLVSESLKVVQIQNPNVNSSTEHPQTTQIFERKDIAQEAQTASSETSLKSLDNKSKQVQEVIEEEKSQDTSTKSLNISKRHLERNAKSFTTKDQLLNKQTEDIERLRNENQQLNQEKKKLQAWLQISEQSRERVEALLRQSKSAQKRESDDVEKVNDQVELQEHQKKKSFEKEQLMDRIRDPAEIKDQQISMQNEADLAINQLNQGHNDFHCSECSDSDDFINDAQSRQSNYLYPEMKKADEGDKEDTKGMQQQYKNSQNEVSNNNEDSIPSIIVSRNNGTIQQSNQPYNRIQSYQQGYKQPQQNFGQISQEQIIQPQYANYQNSLNKYKQNWPQEHQNKYNQRYQQEYERKTTQYRLSQQQEDLYQQEQRKQKPEITLSSLQTSRMFQNKQLVQNFRQYNTNNNGVQNRNHNINKYQDQNTNYRPQYVENSLSNLHRSGYRSHLSYVKIFLNGQMAQQRKRDEQMVDQMRKSYQNIQMLSGK